MNANEPIEKESESGKRYVLTNVDLPLREETQAYLVKGVLLKEDHETIPNKDICLAPIDDTEYIRSAVVDPSYLELFE